MTRQRATLLLALAAAAALGALALLLGGEREPEDTGWIAAAPAASDRTEGAAADLSDLEARPAEAARARALPEPTGGARSVRDRVRTRGGDVAADGPYRGRLLDALGRPLAGVPVELMPWDQANTLNFRSFGRPQQLRLEAVTDEEGRFVAEDSEPLGLTIGLKADARGFLDAPIKHVFGAESTTDLGDVTLDPAVVVEGWVRDDLGRPVEGARVRRVDRAGDQMVETMDRIGFSSVLGLETTDADGRFRLEHEPAGRIVLLAEHGTIMPARHEGPTQEPGDVISGVEITAIRAGVVRGVLSGYPRGRAYGRVAATAVDPDPGDDDGGIGALMSARLSPAGEHIADVDADGSFELGGLQPGARYRIQAMERRQFVETVLLSEPVEATADGSFVSLQFDPGARLELKVIDRDTRRPVEALTVNASWGKRSAKVMLTPAGGRPPKRIQGGLVTLHELRPEGEQGELTVTIDAPGYERAVTPPIKVAAGGLATGGTLELTPATALTFLVTDARTREPIRKARVTLSAGAAFDPRAAMRGGPAARETWAKTGRDGRCELTDLADPEARLEVRARGFATHQQEPFLLAPGQELVEVALAPEAELTVAVVGEEDLLLAGARVECRVPGEDSPWKSGKATGKDGLAVFGGLAAGTYEVRAMRNAGRPFSRRGAVGDEEIEWRTVELAAGDRVRLDYTLAGAATVSGVIRIDGRPAAGARVSVVPADDADEYERFIAIQDQFAGFGNQPSSDTTDAEGRFEIADLGAGPAAVLVRHEDLSMPARLDLEVELGANTVDMDLAISVIEGRAVDQDGAPIAGASVAARRTMEDESARLSRQYLGMSGTDVTTGVDGTFRVRGIKPESSLQLVLRADGYTDRVLEGLTVAAGEALDVGDVRLTEGGSALILSEGGEGASAVAWVKLSPADPETGEPGEATKVELVRAGRALVRGLTPGEWSVTLATSSREGPGGPGGGAESAPVRFEVRPGEQTEVPVEWPR